MTIRWLERNTKIISSSTYPNGDSYNCLIFGPMCIGGSYKALDFPQKISIPASPWNLGEFSIPFLGDLSHSSSLIVGSPRLMTKNLVLSRHSPTSIKASMVQLNVLIKRAIQSNERHENLIFHCRVSIPGNDPTRQWWFQSRRNLDRCRRPRWPTTWRPRKPEGGSKWAQNV